MKYLCAFAALAALAGGSAYAACPFPAPPHQIPDGRTATAEQMKDGQKLVDDYSAAISAYVQCLDMESEDAITKAGDTMTADQKEQMRRITQQKHLAAVAQQQDISARFTEQMRVFTAKEKDKKGF